jgi:peptidoglycan hydrolase-like protein with peptidoglycan-binding domain
MPLQSAILSGNTRLDQAASTGPSIKAGASDDVDAIRRIQKGLAALGYALPRSFPDGPAGNPDGIYGDETMRAVTEFQRRVFPGSFREWDGRAGPNTLSKMDGMLPKSGGATPPTAPAIAFICGPDVTDQIVKVWTQMQTDFRALPRLMKIKACNTILIPIKGGDDSDKTGFPTDLEQLKQKLRQYADIDGWDTIPLFQGASEWLRTPPVFTPDKVQVITPSGVRAMTGGPCATPSSTDYSNTDPFADGHEDEETCSDTVQVAGTCWLNGTVNYGMFGVMVRLCSDFAKTDVIVKRIPVAQKLYSLDWATNLIKLYKRFGQHPEQANDPIAWTQATFNGGPRAVPSGPGNRPKCKCSCGCKATDDVTDWDYIWQPFKGGGRPSR